MSVCLSETDRHREVCLIPSRLINKQPQQSVLPLYCPGVFHKHFRYLLGHLLYVICSSSINKIFKQAHFSDNGGRNDILLYLMVATGGDCAHIGFTVVDVSYMFLMHYHLFYGPAPFDGVKYLFRHHLNFTSDGDYRLI